MKKLLSVLLAAALVLGLVLAWIGANMITVSAACCVLVFILEFFV